MKLGDPITNDEITKEQCIALILSISKALDSQNIILKKSQWNSDKEYVLFDGTYLNDEIDTLLDKELNNF